MIIAFKWYLWCDACEHLKKLIDMLYHPAITGHGSRHLSGSQRSLTASSDKQLQVLKHT
jgi:hypothetical protein